jgi:hypothetical protein
MLRNSVDHVRMKTFVMTSINFILFVTNNPQAQYNDAYINNLNNAIMDINNMIFSFQDKSILYWIMNIVERCDRNQKKDIYNMLHNL